MSKLRSKGSLVAQAGRSWPATTVSGNSVMASGRWWPVIGWRVACAVAPQGTALPETTTPAVNTRLDNSPAHISITYSDPIVPGESWITLLDATGAPVATTTDPAAGPKELFGCGR
jgi:hypothetical protein